MLPPNQLVNSVAEQYTNVAELRLAAIRASVDQHKLPYSDNLKFVREAVPIQVVAHGCPFCFVVIAFAHIKCHSPSGVAALMAKWESLTFEQIESHAVWGILMEDEKSRLRELFPSVLPPPPPPRPRLSGPELEKLHRALVDAFPTDAELERLLRFSLNIDLPEIAGAGPTTDRVFQLLRWTEARGRTLELARAARSRNPENPMLAQTFQELWP
jgi:hypothetical protein